MAEGDGSGGDARVHTGPMRCWRIYSGCPKGAGRQRTLGSARMHIDVCCDEGKEVENSIRRALTWLLPKLCQFAVPVLHLRLAQWRETSGSSGGSSDRYGSEEDAEGH